MLSLICLFCDCFPHIFQYSVLLAICESSWRNWRVGGRGRARRTQALYGQPTASHECEQYQTTRKPKKTKSGQVGHPPCSPQLLRSLVFLVLLVMFNGFALLWGSPFGLFGFCLFSQWFSRVQPLQLYAIMSRAKGRAQE